MYTSEAHIKMDFYYVWVTDSFEIPTNAINSLFLKISHTGEKNLYVTPIECNDPLKRFVKFLLENSIVGWAFGTVIKILPGMPTPHTRVPEFKYSLHLWFWRAVKACISRLQLMVQVVVYLLPTWETHTEFPDSDFGLI